jgi:hypothetical protein
MALSCAVRTWVGNNPRSQLTSHPTSCTSVTTWSKLPPSSDETSSLITRRSVSNIRRANVVASPRYDFRHGSRLYWLTFHVTFLRYSQVSGCNTPRPHPFQFIIHKCPSVRCHITYAGEKAALNELRTTPADTSSRLRCSTSPSMVFYTDSNVFNPPRCLWGNPKPHQ